jgi:4-amino-4-deoxy-L-arabinose transferase-like glycosyltransferase
MSAPSNAAQGNTLKPARRDAGAGPTPPSNRLPVWALVLLAVMALIWFGTLDARHLLRSDEGRYAEIAREMAATGDWVTIRYQGLKYFEKPPLHLWMTALAFEAFGVGDWQSRLWVACSGALGVLVTALAAQRCFGGGLLAALVLMAAPTWNIGSHFNSLDMGVSGALAGVLAALLLAQRPDNTSRAQRLWMWGTWAAMAVAVLTKGLIGIVLPGLALVAYTLLARDWALWRRLHLVSGALVCLAITAPWFVLVSQRNPEFAHFFFIHEHWERYTSSVHQRGAPAWYFVPQLLGGFAPWLGLLPGMFRALRAESKTQAPRAFRPLLFCAVWAVAIFAFFSASGSKLPGYILPVFPALAVLAAAALQGLDAAAWRRQLWMMLALFGALLLASPLIGRTGAGDAVLRHYGLWVSAGCALAVAALLGAAWLQRQGAQLPSIALAAFGFFGATTLGLLGHETLGRPASGADLLPAIHAVLKPDMPIYSVKLLDHTLPYYLRRTVVMVEEPDELAFGTQQEPQKWLPTVAAYTQVWTAGPPALALMSPATYAGLEAQHLPMTVVARDERRVVVANFPLSRPAVP